MNDKTIMPNDYIVTYTKTDTIRDRSSNGDVVYVVKENRVPLIHCRECKYADSIKCPMYRMGLGYTDDDFCSYGERSRR